MQSADIRTIDPNTLVDIRSVNIDQNQPPAARLASFVAQIKNPYCYKVGKAVVKVSFAETNATLEDKLENYLKSLQ